MVHDRANWRMKTRRAALALAVAALPLACLDSPAVHAQSIMRSPSISIGSRIPTITPTVTPRIDPNVADRSEHWPAAASASRPVRRPTLRDQSTGLRLRLPRQRRRMFGASRSRPTAAAGAAAVRRAKKPITTARAATTCRPRSTCAAFPTKSWPRSMARCPTRRPMRWRGVTASRVSDRRIFR